MTGVGIEGCFNFYSAAAVVVAQTASVWLVRTLSSSESEIDVPADLPIPLSSFYDNYLFLRALAGEAVQSGQRFLPLAHPFSQFWARLQS